MDHTEGQTVDVLCAMLIPHTPAEMRIYLFLYDKQTYPDIGV